MIESRDLLRLLTARQLLVAILEPNAKAPQLLCPPSPSSLLAEQSIEAAYDEENQPTNNLALTGFERAQLANLAVENVDEAKNLIPT